MKHRTALSTRLAGIATAATLALAACSSPAPLSIDEPFRDLALSEALDAAESESKVVMIDFFATWCPPCKELEKSTWPDDSVVEWLSDRAVALKKDVDVEGELAKKYGVRSIPTLVFLRSDGTELGRIVGFVPPSEFLSRARSFTESRAGL